MIEEYKRLQAVLASIEMDLAKASSGNSSAGVRARRGLRTAKALTKVIYDASLNVPAQTSPRTYNVFGPHMQARLK